MQKLTNQFAPPVSLLPVNTRLMTCALCSVTAQVKEGEVVLAHAGASGVGTAAIQLARRFGAVPIVTAGSPEKLKMAEELGAAAGFNYKEQSFAQGVHSFTGGSELVMKKKFADKKKNTQYH